MAPEVENNILIYFQENNMEHHRKQSFQGTSKG